MLPEILAAFRLVCFCNPPGAVRAPVDGLQTDLFLAFAIPSHSKDVLS